MTLSAEASVANIHRKVMTNNRMKAKSCFVIRVELSFNYSLMKVYQISLFARSSDHKIAYEINRVSTALLTSMLLAT